MENFKIIRIILSNNSVALCEVNSVLLCVIISHMKSLREVIVKINFLRLKIRNTA